LIFGIFGTGRTLGFALDNLRDVIQADVRDLFDAEGNLRPIKTCVRRPSYRRRRSRAVASPSDAKTGHPHLNLNIRERFRMHEHRVVRGMH
jgi:hypothetical protein